MAHSAMRLYTHGLHSRLPIERSWFEPWPGTALCCVLDNREFTKPRRQRQRERPRTKDLMARTMALDVPEQKI